MKFQPVKIASVTVSVLALVAVGYAIAMAHYFGGMFFHVWLNPTVATFVSVIWMLLPVVLTYIWAVSRPFALRFVAMSLAFLFARADFAAILTVAWGTVLYAWLIFSVWKNRVSVTGG